MVEAAVTKRSRRKIVKEALETGPTESAVSTSTHVSEGEHDQSAEEADLTSTRETIESMEENESFNPVRDLDESLDPAMGLDEPLEPSEPDKPDLSVLPEAECVKCCQLTKENRKLQNRVKSLRNQLTKKKKALRSSKTALGKLKKQLATERPSSQSRDEDDELPGNNILDFSDNESVVEDNTGDGTYETEDETDATTGTEEEEDYEKPDRLTVSGTNLRSEPKHIVFLSQLLLLFKFCHVCKTDCPSLEARQVGSEAVVTSTCSNPKCSKPVNTWHSQPVMPGSGIPAGNFLLCMVILLAGGSASKVLQIFSHMGLACVSLNTYLKYQRNNLFPTIHLYWKKYQAKLLEKAKSVRGGLVIAGDGRHDSMGHSAKFGAYRASDILRCCDFA